MKRTIITITGIALLCLCGCSTTSDNPVIGYTTSRGLDFLDMFEVGVQAGPSFRASVQYGIGVLGIADHETIIARLGQRAMVVDSERYELAAIPYPAGEPLLWILGPLNIYEPRTTLVEVTRGLQEETETPRAGILDERVNEWCPMLSRTGALTYTECGPTGRELYWAKMFPVGAELCWLAGARVRVYPVELVDFIAGIFTVDLLADDVGAVVDDAGVTPE
jgi:hypothetical protein